MVMVTSFQLLTPYPLKPLQIHIGLLSLTVVVLPVVIVFFLEILQFPRRLRNTRNNQLFLVLQQNPNIIQWHPPLMKLFGFLPFFLILAYHILTVFNFFVIVKLLYTLLPTLFFVNGQKQIEMDCHFNRDKIQARVIKTFHLASRHQLIDVLTKPLGYQQFQTSATKMGAVQCNLQYSHLYKCISSTISISVVMIILYRV